MPLSALEYLQHILAETAYLLKSSHGLEKAAFVQDETLKRAYVRSLEVIGEAVKQIPDSQRLNHPGIEITRHRKACDCWDARLPDFRDWVMTQLGETVLGNVSVARASARASVRQAHPPSRSGY